MVTSKADSTLISLDFITPNYSLLAISSNGCPMGMMESILLVTNLTLAGGSSLSPSRMTFICGADVCLDCWPVMTAAIKIIDTSLRDDFGFNHILWVYSGRRGVHCWVSDGKARRLTNEQRASIADYFRVYKGSENSNKKVSLTGHALHPFLLRCYTKVLKDLFENQLLSSQQIFSTEEKCEKILDMIPDESIAAELRGRWSKRPSGRVCIPIDPARCHEFDPTTVPTLSQLIQELNSGGIGQEGDNDWDRTSLGESVRFFRSSFLEPLLKSCKEEMEAAYNAKLQQSKNSLTW
ncbi:DNA primase small subunit [Linum perenne]